MYKPPPPTASAVGPCPTVIRIVGRLDTGSLPSTIEPPDHPLGYCRARAYCACGRYGWCLFALSSIFPLFPSLWRTARYRLKYCLKGPLNPEQPGWSGCAMVLCKLAVPGRPTIWIIVGHRTIALAVGAGGDCLDIFCSPLSFLSSFSLSGRRPEID